MSRFMIPVHVRRFALALIGLSLTSMALEPGARACPQTPLPSLDCSQTTPCCTGPLLDGDSGTWAAGLGNGNNLCDEALLWDIIKDRCSQGALDEHNQLFNVLTDADDGESYASYGLGQCNPEFDYGKHWTSAFLLGTSIKYVPGKTWHHPVEDYLQAGVAYGNDFHSVLEHLHGEGSKPNASFYHHPFSDDEITFICPLFGMSWTGTPVYRASDFIHEAWHDPYGGHDDEDDQDYDRDNFIAHDHQLGPGEMRDHVFPNPVPDDLRIRCFEPGVPCAISSVYQVQYEFLCDMNTTPQDWLPRALAWEAGEISTQLLGKYGDATNTTPFLNLPPFTCDNVPPVRRDPDTPEVTNGRVLRLDVQALLHEDSPLDTDDDTETRNASFRLELTPTDPTEEIHWTSPRLDDIFIEVHAFAELLADGETVKVSYNVRFFEDNVDSNYDCEEDAAGGLNCPAAPWPIETLDSERFDAPPIVLYLDNAHQGWEDRADVQLFFALDW